MIAERISRFPGQSAATLLLVSAFCGLCVSQTGPSVFTNPRAPSDDPRIGLKGGLNDAGEAAFGMQRIATLAKPAGFDAVTNTPATPAEGDRPAQPARIQYGTTNSDLAFSGNHLFVGNYFGINFYDIDNPTKTLLRASLVCPGGQGDVSVYGHLLFMSAEASNGRIDCGTQGIPLPEGYKRPEPPPVKEGELRPPPPPDPANLDRFRGVRIFDISNITGPKQVAAVQTCRRSHTHTLVIDPKDKENAYIYVSGTSFVRQTEELAGCSGEKPDKDPN